MELAALWTVQLWYAENRIKNKLTKISSFTQKHTEQQAILYSYITGVGNIVIMSSEHMNVNVKFYLQVGNSDCKIIHTLPSWKLEINHCHHFEFRFQVFGFIIHNIIILLWLGYICVFTSFNVWHVVVIMNSQFYCPKSHKFSLLTDFKIVLLSFCLLKPVTWDHSNSK